MQQAATKDELKAAVYGLTRLVTGYRGWTEVLDLPEEERLKVLFKRTTAEINNTTDLSEHTSLLRKLRAYSQLLQLQTFCFEEINWEDE